MKVYLYLIDLPHVYHNINSFCEVSVSFTLDCFGRVDLCRFFYLSEDG